MLDWIWTQSLWSIGTAFIGFTAEENLPRWAPIYLATVNIFYNTGFIMLKNYRFRS